jgi:hypothetical protein
VGEKGRKELAWAGSCPEKDLSGHSLLWQGISTSLESMDEGFPRLAQAEGIPSVYVVLMQLNLSGLHYHSVHMSGFAR